jgi:hypothetical protein
MPRNRKKVEFDEVTNRLFDCMATRNGDKDPESGTNMIWATNGRANLHFYNMDNRWLFAGGYHVDGKHLKVDFRAEVYLNNAVMPIPNGMHFEGDFLEATSEKLKLKGIMGGNTDMPTTVELDCKAHTT